MTTKEWLSRGRGIDAEIRGIRERIERTRAQMLRITAEYSGERVQSSPGNTQERRIVRCLDYIAELERQEAHLWEIRREIAAAVGQVRDNARRRLLQYRYLDNLTWEAIAARMSYDTRQVFRIHGQALKDVGEFIPREQERRSENENYRKQ